MSERHNAHLAEFPDSQVGVEAGHNGIITKANIEQVVNVTREQRATLLDHNQECEISGRNNVIEQ